MFNISKKMRDFSSRETKPKDVFVTIKTFLKYHVLLIVPAFATYTDEEKATQNCERKVNFSVYGEPTENVLRRV